MQVEKQTSKLTLLLQFSKSLFFTGIILCLFITNGKAQNCKLSITGKVIDKKSQRPIEFANVYLEKMFKGTTSDSLGRFAIQNICEGGFHLIISHIGCETNEIYFTLKSDTSLVIELDHSSHLLDEVAIEENGNGSTLNESASIAENKIAENSNKNLAGLLENIAGVRTIKNGNGIGKPVVQGLSGNRITILNNGVAQSGQQWGVDHSPEIDPLAANTVQVVKGVGAIEYMGSNLGSVILVEPGKIEKEPHLHGKGTYFFESNGRGHGVNLKLQQYSKLLAWKVSGTYKKHGDYNTPDYFLTNTGVEERNIAVQLEKQVSKFWESNLYFSSFNSDIAVLRGSHIGNLTDLNSALEQQEPFFTQDEFSYDINAPRQEVNHHLVKLKNKLLFDETKWLELTYAAQFNFRKEFDIRRGNRTDRAALSLEQESRFSEAKYTQYLSEELSLKAGVQHNRIENLNVPGTGIAPLIPNYISNEYAGFLSVAKNWEKVNLEAGARYDKEERNVATLSGGFPREVLRFENDFENYTLHLGSSWQYSDKSKLTFNVGLASRNPEVNELYSGGLHQGVSGIEEGNANLQRESSLKQSLSYETRLNEKFYIKTLAYYQNIEDYIYLAPQQEVRLTIRGAFPVFGYEQTNASIYGIDLNGSYEISESFSGVLVGSLIRGRDEGNDTPLINIPSSNVRAELHYELPKLGGFENVEFQFNISHVTSREDEIEELDFVAPPDAYTLLGLKVIGEKQLKKIRLNLFASVTNLSNVRYRDYLNRQRYFADDLGRNITLGTTVDF